jgi:hypothetical protein
LLRSSRSEYQPGSTGAICVSCSLWYCAEHKCEGHGVRVSSPYRSRVAETLPYRRSGFSPRPSGGPSSVSPPLRKLSKNSGPAFHSNRSIFRRFVHVIDHEDIHRAFCRI